MRKAASLDRDAEQQTDSPLRKALSLLEVLARERRPTSLTTLAEVMGLPKTTIYRISAQLEDLGYIQRDPGSRRLMIGGDLVDLAAEILASSVQHGPRRAILADLSRRLGESCVVGVRSGYEIVYIDDLPSDSALTLRFRAGERAPLYCTSMGKIYLARMTASELEAYLETVPLEPFAERTITDRNRLAKELETIRKQGYATSHSELVDGVVGAAVPVLTGRKKMYAALAVSAPLVRMSHEQVKAAVPVLRDAADRLGAALAAVSSEGHDEE